MRLSSKASSRCSRPTPGSSTAWPKHWVACAGRSTPPARSPGWRVPCPAHQAEAQSNAAARTPGPGNAGRQGAASPQRRAAASAVLPFTAHRSFPGPILARCAWQSQRGKEIELMSIIGWLLVGLIAGWLAGMIMGGHGFGILGNIVVGIIGSLVGGFLASAFFGMDVGGFNLPSILVAFVGAGVFLLILR